jgi:hypothetical protein
VYVTAFARFVLFISSYVPLFGVFALLNSFGNGWPTGFCIGLAALGLVVLPTTLLRARKLAPQPLKADTAQVRDGDALAYIATYIVPFAATTATTARERGALGLFVLLIAVIYVRSELFYINPLLALVGYRLFEVATPAGASVVLLTHRRFLASGTSLMARRLGDYVYWETKR